MSLGHRVMTKCEHKMKADRNVDGSQCRKGDRIADGKPGRRNCIDDSSFNNRNRMSTSLRCISDTGQETDL